MSWHEVYAEHRRKEAVIMSLTIQIRWGYDASTAYGCIDKIEMFEEERGEASHLYVGRLGTERTVEVYLIPRFRK